MDTCTCIHVHAHMYMYTCTCIAIANNGEIIRPTYKKSVAVFQKECQTTKRTFRERCCVKPSILLKMCFLLR